MDIIYRNILIEATRLGYTKAQLADILEITRPTLRDRLNGKYPFTSDELKTLKELTGKSIDYLLEEYEARRGEPVKHGLSKIPEQSTYNN